MDFTQHAKTASNKLLIVVATLLGSDTDQLSYRQGLILADACGELRERFPAAWESAYREAREGSGDFYFNLVCHVRHQLAEMN